MHRITDYNANFSSVVRLLGKDNCGLEGPYLTSMDPVGPYSTSMDPVRLGGQSCSNMDDSANLAYQQLNKLKVEWKEYTVEGHTWFKGVFQFEEHGQNLVIRS